ncbi:ornithine cyclodeaminase family protein [Actinomadura atramentaria]|uniref:ornithine cyclodeaminase family protein n=1 Tax=Actinomadura atramentaria TaxID=1990 RepID=UPI00037BB3E1|nr:NAD(P)-binding domain-containing protein [Actinomadura atramentaria]
MTLLLDRSTLESVLEPARCVAALRAGFVAPPPPVPAHRTVAKLPAPGGATALLPGLVDGIPAYTVKVNAKFPAARPALRGVVCLHDLASGELLALLDSATVTAWRTGLAAALGTHVLARSGAVAVGVVGAGAQAELVVRGLAALRDVRSLAVCDLDADRAAAFAGRHGGAPVGSPREAARDADVVVTATWSREPLLSAADVAPGAHVTALGADEPGKAELAPDLLSSARVVVDDVPLATATGVLAGGAVAGPAVLGDVLRGPAPGRRSAGEVTVYAPVGLPWQDLALAWEAYGRAGEGVPAFDFLA